MTKNSLHICLEEMLSTCDIPGCDDFYIVIDGDNGSSRYKPA